jgi:hypothetical protein
LEVAVEGIRKEDLVGRIIGIIIFLGGVGLLVFVFMTAYSWFASPTVGLQAGPVKGAIAPAATQLGQSAMALLVRICLLIVMTIVGSLLAGRGVQLYFAASHAKAPSIAPKDT